MVPVFCRYYNIVMWKRLFPSIHSHGFSGIYRQYATFPQCNLVRLDRVKHPLSNKVGYRSCTHSQNPLLAHKKYTSDPSLRVRVIPMFQDNYGYLIIDEVNQVMFAVDPAEPARILPALNEEEALKKRKLLAILTTHKHAYE